MSKVLMGNELGGGRGHLTALSAVARALKAKHQVVFALPNQSSLIHQDAEKYLTKPSFAWGRHSIVRHATDSFADAIEPLGFAEVGLWRKAVRFWSDLLDRERPSLIVAESAPSLRLAAVGRMPVVVIGSGYAVPPANRLLPNLKTDAPGVPALSRRREATILAAVNQIQAERRGPTLDYVADLFNGDASFIGSLPDLDHYRSYRMGPTWWPCNVPLPSRNRVFKPGPAVFCYLHANHPGLKAVLRLLDDLAVQFERESCFGRNPVQAYFHGGVSRRIANECGARVFIHTNPPVLDDMLADAHLFIHQSGSGGAHHGLASGTVHLLLPLNLEQQLTAHRLEALGVAGLLLAKGPTESQETFSNTLRQHADRLLEGPHRITARRHAHHLSEQPFSDPLSAIVEACNRVIGSKDGS